MIRSELVSRVHAAYPHLERREVETVIAALFDRIITALGDGQRIELRGFGAFSVRERGARTGRNPRTGQSVAIRPKRVPYFKAGKEMRERLNIAVSAD